MQRPTSAGKAGFLPRRPSEADRDAASSLRRQRPGSAPYASQRSTASPSSRNSAELTDSAMRKDALATLRALGSTLGDQSRCQRGFRRPHSAPFQRCKDKPCAEDPAPARGRHRPQSGLPTRSLKMRPDGQVGYRLLLPSEVIRDKEKWKEALRPTPSGVEEITDTFRNYLSICRSRQSVTAVRDRRNCPVPPHTTRAAPITTPRSRLCGDPTADQHS